jgi:hypothetical protein
MTAPTLKISELELASSLQGGEYIPVVQNGVTVKVPVSEIMGQDMIPVVNKSGVAISRGNLVMAAGSDGNSGKIKAAKSAVDTNPMFIIGIAKADIADNATGLITTFGEITSVDCDGSVVGETWVDGDVLYPHPTIAGGLTKGTHTIELPIAMVLSAGNNGVIFVRR